MDEQTVSTEKPVGETPIPTAVTKQEVDDAVKVMQVREAIRERAMAGKLQFNWNGHHKKRVTMPFFPKESTPEFRKEFAFEEDVVDRLSVSAEVADKVMSLITLAKEGRASESILIGRNSYALGCYDCGKELELMYDGTAIYPRNRCQYPDGMPPINAVISVPSGRLVFANHFPGIPEPDGPGIKAFGALAFKRETRHFAKFNIAYAACGNSNPAIWINEKRNQLAIGVGSRDEADNDIAGSFDPNYKKVGRVTTDRWAWAATCEDTAKGLAPFKLEATVKVTPGKYRVSQLFHQMKPTNKVVRVFATLIRIGR